MRLRFRAICMQGCGVLHLTDISGAARNAAAVHRIGAGHDAQVQTKVPDWTPGDPEAEPLEG